MRMGFHDYLLGFLVIYSLIHVCGPIIFVYSFTAVMWAAQQGSTAALDMLLEHGANLEVRRT